MILLRVVPTVILTGGLHAAKSMGLRAAKSWLLANMLCKFRGLHAAKSWSGSLRNLHIDTLDLNFGKPTMRTRITKCLSLFVRPRWIQQHLHVKPLLHGPLSACEHLVIFGLWQQTVNIPKFLLNCVTWNFVKLLGGMEQGLFLFWV